MLLVVDKSSSMLGSLGGLTKWEAAHMAIAQATTDFADAIDFGLMVFPMPNRCAPGEVVVDLGRNSSADILAGLGDPPPSAGNWTPMSQTLDVAASYAPLQDASRENVVVLITDGWQWCDPYDPSTRFDVVASVERLRDLGMTVFIIGFGDGVDALALNRAAAAAGTGATGCDPTSSEPSSPLNCYISALDAPALTAALGSVVGATAAETCDGVDDDCDGRIDEDFDADGDTFTTCGTDPDIPGFFMPDWLDCDDSEPAINPFAEEICDGVDNDCDGVTDPGCACTTGETRPCGMDTGRCEMGTQTCDGGSWTECAGLVGPTVESCNGEDEDCDGTVDEDVSCPAGSICEAGRCVDFSEPPPPMDRDSDGDGLLDGEECPGGEELDTDMDGMPDCRDPDDDNDGILTINERPGFADQDTDGDGRPNHLDPDDDNDSIPTIDERPGFMDVDTDGDGTPDHLDTDDDGDGIPTRQEADEDTSAGDDLDEDGTPSYRDIDSDGDSLLDRDEGDGDEDGDGAPDYLDPAPAPMEAEDLGYAGGGGCSASGAGGGLFALLLSFLFVFRRRR